MKVLYITEQIYLHGGAEKILIQKLNYWAEVLGWEAMVVTSEQRGNPVCYPLSDKVRHVDLDIGYVPGHSYFGPKNILKFPKHYSALQKQIKTFAPDAVFLISLTWIRYALPFLAKGFPIYNEYHTSYYGFELGYENATPIVKIKKKIAALFIKWIEDRYTNIVFLNQAEYDHYNRANGIIIPNFFEGHIDQLPLQRPKQIISLGRMNYQKGYDLLIEAWAKIDHLVDGWTVKVFGNGDDKTALRARAAKHHFRNELQINDAIPDVSRELLQSAFYVMSSRFETFPMVLLEALSHGLPVVSFDCPTGPRSICREGEDALLAVPENPDSLAAQMLEMIGNASLRHAMALQAPKNVDRFRPAVIMAQWEALVRHNSKA